MFDPDKSMALKTRSIGKQLIGKGCPHKADATPHKSALKVGKLVMVDENISRLVSSVTYGDSFVMEYDSVTPEDPRSKACSSRDLFGHGAAGAGMIHYILWMIHMNVCMVMMSRLWVHEAVHSSGANKKYICGVFMDDKH